MSARCLLLIGFVFLFGPAGAAQTPAVTDGVALLLNRIEKLLASGDAQAVDAVISPVASAEPLRSFASELLLPGTTRAVVRERDRTALDGTLPGDGYRLVVDFFIESNRTSRIVTARLDVRRAHRAGDEAEWRVAAAERLSTVDGLHRLAVNTRRQYTAHNLAIEAEDLRLYLGQGTVFTVDGDDGVSGLVLFGRGEMQFSPKPEAERTQVRIFCGEDTLVARFDSAFVRLNPGEYSTRVSQDNLTEAPIDTRMLRRAQEMFDLEGPKSFSLDLQDLSRDTWYLVPGYSDFLAEVRTKKHGTLTYARSSGEAEDVTLFDRSKQRNISLYASPQKLASRGRFYDEDELSDYDILHHDIEATITPDREFVEARARMRIRVRAYALTTLTVRLAEPLSVLGVASVEHGRLLHLRVKNQNSIVVNLPTAVPRDGEMNLVIAYSGRLRSQGVDREAIAVADQRSQDDNLPYVPAEPHYLLSNRAYWHPQGSYTDYATATLRITVPEPFSCIASGEMTGPPQSIRSAAMPQGARQYTFTAVDPLRYLSVVVSRFARVSATSVPLVEDPSGDHASVALSADGRRAPGFRVRDRIGLVVDANPRQTSRGRDMTGWAGDILQFYAGIIGEAPYPTMTIALVEHDLPGGHSPGYFAVMNNPLPSSPFVWRNDPAAFQGFPEFFLAHELAHQWWGQAVGWKNYHEQWISEGFAQYFAALYAQKARGEDTFNDMLRQFRRWGLAESDQGPIHLGYRLGHIKGDQRVFRGLVYNKGAAVLHMLRRLVGDEVFFNGLRRFYYDRKFDKAGTDDLQRAFEQETGQSFERFFERWIHGVTLPRLRYAATMEEGAVTMRFTQLGEQLFDVPVTVTLTYTDGRTDDVVVPVTEREVVKKIPLEGSLRDVGVNKDSAALAQFDES